MGTREVLSTAVAVLAGLGTVQNLGETVTAPDVLISASICFGITYGVSTAFMKLGKRENSHYDNSAPDFSETNHQNPHPIDPELQAFLNSLPKRMNEEDGWYRDPANLYLLRYFSNGRWTLAVSDSDSDSEKSSAIAKFLPYLESLNKADAPSDRSSTAVRQHGNSTVEPKNANLDSTAEKLNHLERLGNLRRSNTITEEEFQILKKQIIF